MNSEENKKEVFCYNCGLPIEDNEPFFEQERDRKIHRSADCLLDEFSSVAVFILEFTICVGCGKKVEVSTGDLLIVLGDGAGFCHYNTECIVKAIEKGE